MPGMLLGPAIGQALPYSWVTLEFGRPQNMSGNEGSYETGGQGLLLDNRH